MAKKSRSKKKGDKLRELIEKELEKKRREEIKQARERDEIERRLERAERELEVIEKKSTEVTGVDRIKEELSKIKSEFVSIPVIPKDKEKRTIYGLISIIAFLAILAAPLPGLSVLGQKTLAIFVFVIMLWILEVLPLPAAALAPGILLYFLGVKATPAEAFITYAHPAVFFIIGSLLIAQGLIRSGLGKRFAMFLMSKCRNNPTLLLLLLVTVSASLAAFISDHLVVALLLPVVMTIVATANINGKFKIALVLGIAYGAAIAGLATPSGGARNVVTLGLLEEMTTQQIAYVDWMIAAIPITLLLIPCILFVLRILFPPERGINLEKAVEEIKESLKPMSTREWKALAVFIVTIILFITTSDLIGLGTIAIIGAILMFLVGAVEWEEAEKSVSWGVMFIYGAALTMGIALKDSGAADWLAVKLLYLLPHSSALILVAGTIITISVLTNIMSDGAVASIMAPITINVALLAGIEPKLMVLATAVPCAFAFTTIFGTPGNTIAYSSGFFKSQDMHKTGIIVQAIALIVMLFIVKYYWSYLGLF